MSDWFQVPALAGPLDDIHRVVPKPLLHCLGCVQMVIVMLEGELSSQSEVLSALNQISLRISLYLAAFSFPSSLITSPVPATEKHPQCMMLPPPCFTHWDGIIQFKFICIVLFTIQSLQSALQEIKFLQYIYTLQKLNILTYGKIC